MSQLKIPAYILENRLPTLEEICYLLPDIPVQQKARYRNPFRKKAKYPKNWKEISQFYKRKVDYRCQVCQKQCLKPEDSTDGLTPSQISQLTLNCHHINGNTFENSSENIFVVCSKHHLQIHRGTGGVPPRGQMSLFSLSKI